MRFPKYLSPSSIRTFLSDRETFYLQYMAGDSKEDAIPRIPQTRPMSVGSAFDAYAKSYLVRNLFGETKPEFELETIFESQVEEQNRDWARPNGLNVFNCYRESGALADLLLALENAVDEPRFEFKIEQRVARSGIISPSDAAASDAGVPLLGKPDLFFKTKDGTQVILDWKVNGYCGKSDISPKSQYVMVRDSWTDRPHKPNHGSSHKDAYIMKVGGLDVNVGAYFETTCQEWADQLGIYAWVLGIPVGGTFINWIDQLCAVHGGTLPVIRVATHRARMSEAYQIKFYTQIAGIWKTIRSGHIFEAMTPEENASRCSILDKQYLAFQNDPTGMERIYREGAGVD